MSDASVPHCLVCGRVRYDCACAGPGSDEREPVTGLLADLPRRAKVVAWVLGRIEDLKRTGLVGGAAVMSVRGMAAFDQLEASGFRPSVGEIRTALARLNRVPECAVPDEMVGLVYRYKDPACG